LRAQALRAQALRAQALRAQASCDDLSGSFLAPQCQLGKAGKSHTIRTAHAAHDAGNIVATLPIGRADSALQAGPQEAVVREASPRESGSVTTNEAPTVVMPLPKPAALDKKPVKTAHRQAPSQQAPSREAASPDTPAARSPGFDFLALFRQPPRTGSSNLAFQ
jgi:hypothetical protein